MPRSGRDALQPRSAGRLQLFLRKGADTMRKIILAAAALLALAAPSAAPVIGAAPASAQPVQSDAYTASIAVSTSWADLEATYGAMASVPAYVHNLGNNPIVVLF